MCEEKTWSNFSKRWEEKASDGENTICIKKIRLPIGEMIIGATDKGICMVEFYSLNKLEKTLLDFQKRKSIKVKFKSTNLLKSLEEELRAYFNKELKNFSLSLDPIGTEFQKKVWTLLGEIPFGKTLSYSEQAKRYGNIKSIRAVASANSRNKIGILLPCHRVIGKNGDLTGYAGGLDKKSWLLEHEGALSC